MSYIPTVTETGGAHRYMVQVCTLTLYLPSHSSGKAEELRTREMAVKFIAGVLLYRPEIVMLYTYQYPTLHRV